MELWMFYIFAAILVGASAMVVFVRNPVFAALFLVLAFFTSACIWVLLEAEFLALTLVLVYVGAVMVLFLFVVMMLDINLAPLKKGFYRYLPAGGLVALLIVFQLVLLLGGDYFGLTRMPDPAPQDVDYSNTRDLGMVLYTVYLYPFEIAAVILLVAIIAAIALTMRRRKEKEFMQPEQQVLAKRSERVRLVKMSVEKK